VFFLLFIHSFLLPSYDAFLVPVVPLAKYAGPICKVIFASEYSVLEFRDHLQLVGPSALLLLFSTLHFSFAWLSSLNRYISNRVATEKRELTRRYCKVRYLPNYPCFTVLIMYVQLNLALRRCHEDCTVAGLILEQGAGAGVACPTRRSTFICPPRLLECNTIVYCRSPSWPPGLEHHWQTKATV